MSNTPGSRAREVLALPSEELARAMAPSQAASFIERAAARDPRRLLAAVADSGAWATCRHDEVYPEWLGDLGDAPSVIFGRGDPGRLAGLPREDTVTIVGSRRPSHYGREIAREFGREIAAAGFAVVSGMAMGIDSCAHEGALDAGGLTVAVLGTGVDVPYPPRATRLYERIVERGVVVGELPPGTQARRWMFPARNRIMAALGRMTVVVEARERSGSLITAEMAQDLNREVGAVPGRVGKLAGGGNERPAPRGGSCHPRGAGRARCAGRVRAPGELFARRRGRASSPSSPASSTWSSAGRATPTRWLGRRRSSPGSWRALSSGWS